MIARAISVDGSINPASVAFLAAKRTGRPPVADPASERSRKPWLAADVSQRTYYRRKAVAAAKAPPAPVQHASHVAAWVATLDAIARLDHRALVRRCHRDQREPKSLSGAALLLLYMRAIGAS